MISQKPQSFDPIWETIYRSGHANSYPWDAVVSFIWRHRPKIKSPADTDILEIGCGTGPNLWFAAREGFRVSGIDASETAIIHAKERFDREDLTGDLRVADFTELPFENNIFDLAIDRVAITCCGMLAASKAVSEIYRVLRVGGRFFFNAYADGHTSQSSGRYGPDGVILDIQAGTLTGVGQIKFYTSDEINKLFSSGWRILSKQYVALEEHINSNIGLHCEWRIVVEKKD